MVAPSQHPVTALALAISFLAGFAAHPANWFGWQLRVEPEERFLGHELADVDAFDEAGTTTATSGTTSVLACAEVNLTKDCALVELPASPLRLAGSGLGSTIEVPVIITGAVVLGAEVLCGVQLAGRWRRLASEERQRRPLGEARLVLQ